MILVALAPQVTSTAPAPSVPARFSILQPACREPGDDKTIIVCARGPDGQRLPLPDERGPPDGAGANRALSGATALALQGTPCAATQRGCTVGFGAPIIPLVVGGAVSLAKSAFARHPDKSNRIPIPLDDPAGPTTAPVTAP